MGPRCSSAETHVCHRSYIIAARLLLEAKSVAQQQIVDAMLKDYDPTTMTGNTLHSDATSFELRHWILDCEIGKPC
jgi:hypothetical protein